MVNAVPCSVSPLNTTTASALQKRRSRSLEAIVIKNDSDRLSCYRDTCTPTSPVVAMHSMAPKRRHSLHEPHHRLATIYGWVTAAKPSVNVHTSNRWLQTSRSFPHIPAAADAQDNAIQSNSNKLTRMLENISLLFPNKAMAGGHRQSTTPAEINPPPLPIENDPHIFDLLAKDTSSFIHFGKSDTTITSATVEKLIEKLTREMDNEFIMDFFLTYRQFLSPIKLCKLLILRFRWALLQDDDERVLIRIRTFVAIRHWLTHYWTYDFTRSRTLRYVLSTFLTQLQSNPVILASPRDGRIVKNLRNVLKRQRQFYQHWEDQNPNEKLPPRKDSAIGMSSCHNSIHSNNTPPSPPSSWTDKVKRSLSKSKNGFIKQQQSNTPSTFSTAVCSCNNLTDSSLNLDAHREQQQQQHDHQDASPVTIHNNNNNNNNNNHSSRFFHLSTITVNATCNYRSIILKYRSETIAQQFCLIEKNMLQNVTWDELVDLRWRKRSAERASYVIEMTTLDDDVYVGVDQMIGFFNMTCQWVASEIVRSQQFDTRVRVIEKFLRIALKCYHHRNYSTLMQILLGLQSPAVSRLEKTWQEVDESKMELFNQLKEMAKPFKNWKNVRDCMTKATEEVAESFAVESVLTKSLKAFDHTNGCIPFLGLYLSDLVFVAELPTFIESTCDVDHHGGEEEDKDLCKRLSQSLVNYNKFRIAASVVKHVLSFQVLSRAYNFKILPALYTHLRSISSLDNAEIRKASFLCEE